MSNEQLADRSGARQREIGVSPVNDDTKACPVCGETIKAAPVKCRFCNTDLAAFAASREAEIEKPLFSDHPAVIHSAWQWIAVYSRSASP